MFVLSFKSLNHKGKTVLFMLLLLWIFCDLYDDLVRGRYKKRKNGPLMLLLDKLIFSLLDKINKLEF